MGLVGEEAAGAEEVAEAEAEEVSDANLRIALTLLGQAEGRILGSLSLRCGRPARPVHGVHCAAGVCGAGATRHDPGKLRSQGGGTRHAQRA